MHTIELDSAPMGIFHFEFDDLARVEPWGTAPNLSFSWFAPTVGHYHLEIGGQQIFRYTPEILAHWETNGAERPPIHYVDDQLSRLREDLLELVPDLLQPLPVAFEELIATGAAHAACAAALERDDALDPELTQRWLWSRSLSSGHSYAAPCVHFFRFGDEIIIRATDLGGHSYGKPLWAASASEERLPIERFIGELRAFDAALLKGMAARIARDSCKPALPPWEDRHTWSAGRTSAALDGA